MQGKSVASRIGFVIIARMRDSELLRVKDLAAVAKKFREASGKSQAEAARELRVSKPAMAQAENNPETSFLKLRCRIIERYSEYRVVGPVFLLQRKTKSR